VLTKRAERMQRYCSNRRLLDTIVSVGAAIAMNAFLKPASNHPHPYKTEELRSFPLSNVWLGVSAERQQEADERIPLLLQTPAAIRFVSCEPLLGPINLFDFIGPWGPTPQSLQAPPQLDWIIVGGESGPGARPMHPDWARSLRDQCEAAGVKFFFKQWGVWGRVGDQRPSPNHLPQDADICTRVGKKLAGRLLDGREHNEFPEVSA
jgi:protein gp37